MLFQRCSGLKPKASQDFGICCAYDYSVKIKKNIKFYYVSINIDEVEKFIVLFFALQQITHVYTLVKYFGMLTSENQATEANLENVGPVSNLCLVVMI